MRARARLCQADPMSADDGQKRLILVACILGSGIVFLDGSVVNVALPAISDELGSGLAAQQWVVDAYLLTLSSLLLLGGSLGDLYGRRRVFNISLIGFGVTSTLCAVAPTTELLIAARALQGLDGALLVPSSLAIITSTFDQDERARAIGSWTAWTGLAFVIGPLAGGLFVDAVSWRLVFAINIPFVAVTVAILRRVCPEFAPRREVGVDWLGAALVALGLAGPVFALIEQPARGFADPVVWIPLAAAIPLLTAFVVHEHRAPAPMMPLSLFRERNFTVTNLASFAIYGGLGATTFIVVLYLQQVAAYSAFQAGLALLPITVLMLALASRFGVLADRFGPRLPMALGPIVAAGGLALLAGVPADAPYVGSVLAGVVVFGFGLAMTVAPLTATVLGAAPRARAGVASGVNNTVSRMAALIAIAAVGAIISAQFNASLDTGTAGLTLSAAGERTLVDARERPLAVTPPGELTQATRNASVDAYRLGMLIAAALALTGGIVAGLGIRNPSRSSEQSRRSARPAAAS